MKSTPYKIVRDGVLTRMGIDAAQPLLSSQAAALAEYLTSAAAYVWNFDEWPQITHTEQRLVFGSGFTEGAYTYESDYQGTLSYIGRAPQGSLFSEPVWRIKRVTTTADGQVLNIDTSLDVSWDSRTTATYVEDSTNDPSDIIPYFPLVVAGKLPIGEVLAIYSDAPSDTRLTDTYDFVTTADTVFITDERYAGGPVYVKFQLPVPKFTATAYNAATAYAAEDLVYHAPTGDCYEALQATTGNAPTNEEFWLRHRIPAFIADYLKTTAHAETLAEDGQTDKSQYQLLRAEGILLKLRDDIWLRNGAVRHYSAKFDYR